MRFTRLSTGDGASLITGYKLYSLREKVSSQKLGLGPMAEEIGAARLRNLQKKAAQYEQPFGLSSDEMCAGSIQRSTRSQGRSQLDRR